jgi:Uma2 family endonuclease
LTHPGNKLLIRLQKGILHHVTAAHHPHLITVEEYLAGELHSPVKHEYTGGYVYAMAGARNAHNTIAGNFFGLLFSHLRGRPCQPFNSDTKVRIRLATHTRFYYPDGMVVCQPNDAQDTFQDRPVILAEVISRDTRRIDEGEKRDAYLTIPELCAYLLIESTSPRVAVYHRTDSGFALRQYEGLGAMIPLDAINAQLALKELYELIDFSAAAKADEPIDGE